MNAGAAVPFGWIRAAELGLSFRRIIDDDAEFLASVHAASRVDEFAVARWPESQQAAFVRMQFALQHMYLQKKHPAADWLIVMQGGQDVGRLYIVRWTNQHRILDLALLPEYRGKGAGEALLRDLMDEAAGLARTVSIHVEKHNPATRLCRRLGFTIEEDEGLYNLLRWKPPRTSRLKLVRSR
jgi:ribosomal protein S18 acetylase RimI-like enzyme